MIKKLLLLLLLLVILLVFVISYFPVTKDVNENVEEEISIIEGSNESIEPEEAICTAGWKCQGKEFKAYHYANCSWGQKKKCPLECVNGTCRAGEICTPGFKCVDNMTQGYQLESCSWQNTKDCLIGCVDGKCLPVPENYTEVVVEEVVEEVEETTLLNRLDLGDEMIIGENHTLKVYNINANQVILEVNGDQSEWLFEGDSLSVAGSNFTVTAIYFQSYLGGMKAIDYTIK